MKIFPLFQKLFSICCEGEQRGRERERREEIGNPDLMDGKRSVVRLWLGIFDYLLTLLLSKVLSCEICWFLSSPFKKEPSIFEWRDVRRDLRRDFKLKSLSRPSSFTMWRVCECSNMVGERSLFRNNNISCVKCSVSKLYYSPRIMYALTYIMYAPSEISFINKLCYLVSQLPPNINSPAATTTTNEIVVQLDRSLCCAFCCSWQFYNEQILMSLPTDCAELKLIVSFPIN
jgi:hypothetical protein